MNRLHSIRKQLLHCRDCFVIAALLTVCLCSESASAELKNQSRPNILIITADNLGYGDLKSYNPDSPIHTPNLNRLASQGARLTGFYTASPTCTVSRACLMSGRIPQRHGLEKQLAGLKGNYGVGLNQKEILIPQILKTAPIPYATGCFGKWNIGFAAGSRPTERGFDEFIGHASGNIDYYHHIYAGKHDLFKGTQELHVNGKYSPELFADSAIDFIKRRSNKKQPWFCYLPFNSPHFPSARNKKPGQPNRWQAPDSAFEHYEFSPDETDPLKRYYAVVTALDFEIGRVLASLDTAGVSKNTFVFFFSDNGAFRLNRKGLDVGSNAPLRSGGVTCFEGGLRVVAMARWPGKIEAGTVIGEMLWSPDLLIASQKLSGAKLPSGVVYDGKDPLPVLLCKAKSPHESLFFIYGKQAALRKGDWKIVRTKPDQPWQLYNLSLDRTEKNNLAKSEPQRLEELKKEFIRWQESL